MACESADVSKSANAVENPPIVDEELTGRAFEVGERGAGAEAAIFESRLGAA